MSNIIAIGMTLLSYILVVDYNAYDIQQKKQLINNIIICILLKCLLSNITNLYNLIILNRFCVDKQCMNIYVLKIFV